MEALTVEILNPKAKKLLKDLADLNLISIGKSIDSKTDFKKLLTKLRSEEDNILSPGEITKEVELVRTKRYANKGK